MRARAHNLQSRRKMRIKYTARRKPNEKMPNSENDDDDDAQSLASIASDTTTTPTTTPHNVLIDDATADDHLIAPLDHDSSDREGSDRYVTPPPSELMSIAHRQQTTGCSAEKTAASPVTTETADKNLVAEDELEDDSAATSIKFDSRSRHYVCVKCNRKYKSKYPAQKHAQKPIRCNVCNREFCNVIALSKHVWKQHTNNDRTDGNHIRKSQKCEWCDKCFSSKTKLKEHEANHIIESNESDFTYCEICEKSLKSRYMYDRHIERHQREIFKCTICYKGFDTEQKLECHIARECDTVPYHECRVCGKKITSAIYFGYHLNGHSGETPFRCNECDASFGRPCMVHMAAKKRRSNHEPKETIEEITSNG